MDCAESTTGRRRERDAIEIAGDYQARALRSDRLAQRFWHEAKFRLIERVALPGPADFVLDAGCGSGTISHFLAQHAAHVVGADSNPEAIGFARNSFTRSNLEFVLGQFEELEELSRWEPCDWIYSIEVIEHLYREQVLEVLSLFRRLTKPGGHLFLTTPNYHGLWPLIEWTLDHFKLVPNMSEGQHVSYFFKTLLKKSCEQTGWKVEQIGTFNGIAPFFAPFSYRLALALEKWEYNCRLYLPGNLLFCICRNEPVPKNPIYESA
jgi:2-polyprenyl-3-methyl-5-hydroxy-6-metoxy-1,4-benzoquinol methylase